MQISYGYVLLEYKELQKQLSIFWASNFDFSRTYCDVNFSEQSWFTYLFFRYGWTFYSEISTQKPFTQTVRVEQSKEIS